MGQTLKNLASSELTNRPVFNNRFVVELCEKVHIHYRNLRIILSLSDWLQVCQGMIDSMKRWETRGNPEPVPGTHIELCRKEIARFPEDNESIKINLNKNLYPQYEGKIFADGAGISDETYIHLKIRDLRLEMSLDEFNKLADCIATARKELCQEQVS